MLRRKIALLFRDATVSPHYLAAPFFGIILTPIILLPGDPPGTRLLRSLWLVLVASLLLVYPRSRAHMSEAWQGLHPWLKAALLVAGCATAASTVTWLSAHNTEYLAGIAPEPLYLGPLQLAAIVLMAIYLWRDAYPLLFSRLTLAVMGAVLAVSLVYEFPYVLAGERALGLVGQSTSLAAYASVVILLALLRKTIGWPEWFVAGLAAITLGLAASRLGLLVLVVLVAVYVWRPAHNTRLWLVAFLAVGAVGTLLATGGISRLGAQRVIDGVTYRSEVYAVSLEEVVREHLFVGSGPGQLPAYLNDERHVPDDVARTLATGLRFASAHNVFLDISLQYGAVAAASLLAVVGGWLVRASAIARQLRRSPSARACGALLLVGGVELMLNVPSPVTLPLVAVIVGAWYCEAVRQ